MSGTKKKGRRLMKLPDNTSALDEIARRRRDGETVVFTNGCFDLIHIGHLRYLGEAKRLGDILVVGLNSDASVRSLKSAGRPILPQAERQEMLLSLKAVDYVLIFDEDTPLRLIETVRPDVLVKGGDWPIEKIVGHDVISSYGGRTLSLPFLSGYSTTDLIRKIRTSSAGNGE